MPSLKAAPGRVVVRFPKPQERTESGLYIPQTSQMRPEFPVIISVGVPTESDSQILYAYLLEKFRTQTPVAVSYHSGVSYWKENYDPKVLGWLKDLRTYSYRELASELFEGEESEMIAAGMRELIPGPAGTHRTE